MVYCVLKEHPENYLVTNIVDLLLGNFINIVTITIEEEGVTGQGADAEICICAGWMRTIGRLLGGLGACSPKNVSSVRISEINFDSIFTFLY